VRRIGNCHRLYNFHGHCLSDVVSLPSPAKYLF
jgi:hypothetical protein